MGSEYAALRGNKMAIENGKEYYARPPDVSLSHTNLFPHEVVSVRDLRYYTNTDTSIDGYLKCIFYLNRKK